MMVDVLKEYIPVFRDKAEIVGLSDLISEYGILDNGL